jgi:hypothetical protein
MFHPNRRALTMGLALCAAVSALSLSPLIASAEPGGSTDPGARCAAKIGPGQYEFYLPGERATDVNGNKWVCGADGQWFRDYSAMTVRGSTSRPPVISVATVNLAPPAVFSATVAP